MKFSVNTEIFTKFDNPRIGVTIVRGADNFRPIDLGSDFEKLSEEVQDRYSGKILSEIPQIVIWREAYRTFGAKPKDYPSSIEALIKRAAKGGSFWGINPLVDIYNYVSVKHLLPAGGEDIDKMSGDLELTFAGPEENPVKVLGKDSEEAPKEGEVIYKDMEGTICRRWNWREVARTILDNETKNCILVFEALGPVSNEELAQAQNELSELVEKHLGAKTESHILDSDNTSLDITI